MLRDALGRTCRFLGYTVQYGCIAHCAFEYLGGIVVCSGPSMEPTIQNSDVVFSENLSRHFYCIRKYAPGFYIPSARACQGDIVIVKSPSDPKSNICKRVIGLEGDKVCTSNPSDFLKSHSYVVVKGLDGGQTPHKGIRWIIHCDRNDKFGGTGACHTFHGEKGTFSGEFQDEGRYFSADVPPGMQTVNILCRQVPKGHVWLEGDNLRNSTDSRCYGPVPYGLIRGRICLKLWPLNDFGFLRASPNGHRFLDD